MLHWFFNRIKLLVKHEYNVTLFMNVKHFFLFFLKTRHYDCDFSVSFMKTTCGIELTISLKLCFAEVGRKYFQI